MVEFISYDGAFPCLCHGTLVLRIDGEVVKFDDCLMSGGSLKFDNDWMEFVTQGEWSVCDIPDKYAKYIEEITEVVNDNVRWGCCGGCV